MVKDIKKNYIKTGILLFIILFVIGAVLLGIASDGISAMLKPKGDLDYMYGDEIEPMRASYTVTYIMDYFSYYTEGSATVEKEYFIPVGEEEYMAIDLSGAQMDKADNNMEATWAIMEGDDSAYDDVVPFVVTGSIVPLEGDSLKFYREYINELDWTAEEKELFLPYILKPGYVGPMESATFYILVILGLILIVIGICLLISGFSNKCLKQIKKFCKDTGNEEAAMARVEQFYQTTPGVNNIRISPEFFMWLGGGKATFMSSDNILWAYQHVVKHSYNFIPTGKTYSIMVKLADGKTLEIGMGNQQKAAETLDYFARSLPYIYIGYDPQWMTMFSSNRQFMIQAVSDRRMQMNSQPDYSNMLYPNM